MFDLLSLNQQLIDLQSKSKNPQIWKNSDAKNIFKSISLIEKKLKYFNKMQQDFVDLVELTRILTKKDDIETIKNLFFDSEKLLKNIINYRYENLLNEEADNSNSFLEVHAGAGGTESQDWAEMLRRMYMKWSTTRDYKCQLINEHKGDEAGIKSSTIKVEGEYVFGWLKSESGIHRLVRISPFDSGARRHTSFASVWVYPVVDENIDIEIIEKDLRIDTYRSSGAGGQHVNTTDSAVRITHMPTKIVVQCQNERSQHKNKETCMNMLKARLYNYELKKREDKTKNLESGKSDIGWGHQIRSYILHPYRLVKDNRTNHESSNPDKILDGDIDEFLESNLYNLNA